MLPFHDEHQTIDKGVWRILLQKKQPALHWKNLRNFSHANSSSSLSQGRCLAPQPPPFPTYLTNLYCITSSLFLSITLVIFTATPSSVSITLIPGVQGKGNQPFQRN